MAKATTNEPFELLFVQTVDHRPWGDILRRRDDGAAGRLEASVEMTPDRTRFFLRHASGRVEDLSARQFCTLILSLKATGAFQFRRSGKRPRTRENRQP